jgi:hypothetical protein
MPVSAEQPNRSSSDFKSVSFYVAMVVIFVCLLVTTALPIIILATIAAKLSSQTLATT